MDGMTVTLVAVTGVPNAGALDPEDGAPDVVGEPTAVMHNPLVTWASDPVTIVVKEVVAV